MVPNWVCALKWACVRSVVRSFVLCALLMYDTYCSVGVMVAYGRNCDQNIGCYCCCCSNLSHHWFHFWTVTVAAAAADAAAAAIVFNYTLIEMCEQHSLSIFVYISMSMPHNVARFEEDEEGEKNSWTTAIMRSKRKKKTHACTEQSSWGAISVKDGNEKSSLNKNEI